MASNNSTSITQESIRQRLSTVCDPVLERSIVQSGQLDSIHVDSTAIRITVDLISPGYPKKDQLDTAIRSALSDLELPLHIQYGLKIPHKPARQDLNRLPTVKNVIAVAAGKGGVGKSTLSVNLALSLQALNAQVGILDADIYGPSVPKMLGALSRASNKSEDGTRISPAIYRNMPVMSVEFFVEMGRAVIWRGPMIHKLLQQFLEDVEWGELDYLIVDMPPGTGDAQLSLCQLIPITAGLIVTTPQEVALMDVRKAADMFHKLDTPVVGVVENMSHYQCPNCGHQDAIFASGGGRRLAEELSVPLLGQLPIDTRVSHGGESGQPIVVASPGSPHAKVLREVAAQTAMHCARLSASGPRRSTQLKTI